MITYLKGDATNPDIAGTVAIAHVLSDTGAYGAGFAKAIGERYPRAREQYEAWAGRLPTSAAYQRPFALGAVQWVGVGHYLGRAHPWHSRWVVNMVAQHGLRSANNPRPLDLDALAECLSALGTAHLGPIAMPRIGCGLAGGTWDDVGPLVETLLADRDVWVYDLSD